MQNLESSLNFSKYTSPVNEINLSDAWHLSADMMNPIFIDNDINVKKDNVNLMG